MKKDKIKITKQEVFLAESKIYNACISNDFYNQYSKYPIVMSVEHTKSKNKCFTEWYQDRDEALDEFQHFVAHQNKTGILNSLPEKDMTKLSNILDKTAETVAKEYQHTEQDLIDLFGKKTIH